MWDSINICHFDQWFLRKKLAVIESCSLKKPLQSQQDNDQFYVVFRAPEKYFDESLTFPCSNVSNINSMDTEDQKYIQRVKILSSLFVWK